MRDILIQDKMADEVASERPPEQEETENEQHPEEQLQDVEHVEPRRSTRERRPRQLIQPSMRGQSYDDQVHLQTSEESATECSQDVARYWVQMMQAAQERFQVDARRITGKKRHKKFPGDLQPKQRVKEVSTEGFRCSEGRNETIAR